MRVPRLSPLIYTMHCLRWSYIFACINSTRTGSDVRRWLQTVTRLRFTMPAADLIATQRWTSGHAGAYVGVDATRSCETTTINMPICRLYAAWKNMVVVGDYVAFCSLIFTFCKRFSERCSILYLLGSILWLDILLWQLATLLWGNNHWEAT